MKFSEILRIFKDCELWENKILVKSNMHEVLEYIVQNYTYKMLKEIVAVENQDGYFDLIYDLYSVEDDEDVLLQITVKNDAESVTDLFESAVADEKEIYDMFGINFIGHEDLKRLYMPEDWNGFPLRKDYVQDDTRLVWNDSNKV